MKEEGSDNSSWFIYMVTICSMLLVFPLKIGGMDVLSAAVFFISIGWMIMNIVQINQGGRRTKLKYRRLYVIMLALMMYELAGIAVSMMQETEEGAPEPDYSWNLLIIGVAMLYLLTTEVKEFRMEYLDGILYGGLVVMAILLLGYLYDTTIGKITVLWGDKTAAASYLILISVVGALQYCRCGDRMKSCFYGMCAAMSFFLLACNQSVVSFWIVAFTLLAIPVLLLPTADLCKKAMQMFLLFMVMISSMGLIANNTGLLLISVSCDPEHCVCLTMIAAIVGLAFFYCWDRLPEGAEQKKIVMKGFYRIDLLILRGMLIAAFLLVTGNTVWQNGEREGFFHRAVLGFSNPLTGELAGNHSFLCDQGIMGGLLCITALVLFTEGIRKAWAWDKPIKGMLCVAALSLLLQILLWEVCPNILPVAVILATGAITCAERRERFFCKNIRVGTGRDSNLED